MSSQHEFYNANVFINCPFDKNYFNLLHAITFTIIRCSFIPHCALEHDDASTNRIDKLYRLIEICRYGIHDISNTELDSKTRLPRFNMPFELGLFLAAKKFGNEEQQKKKMLVFEKEKFQSKIYLSDLNGIDPKAHDNNAIKIIEQVRSWLSTASRKKLPGHLIIQKEFSEFYNNSLPQIVSSAGLTLETLSFNDYCLFVEEWLTSKL